MTNETILPLLVSTLGGAAVGVERQWSGHAEGVKARFAGLRTFTLLGLLGGIAGQQWLGGGQWLAALLVGAAATLVVVAYAAASRRDVDGTTEVAALVVLASGVLAGHGEMQVASGVIALTVLLLVEKSRLHALVRLLDDRGFRAGARFAVLALVVLPLLPEGPFGPMGGIRPRALWALVLFFSGLSFAGYIARTIVGDRYGHTVTGLLGGLVSIDERSRRPCPAEPGVRRRWHEASQRGAGGLRGAVRARGARGRGPQRDAAPAPVPAAGGAAGRRNHRSVALGAAGHVGWRCAGGAVQSAATGRGPADGRRIPGCAVPARGRESLVR